jgi:hypothetical protein
LGLKLFKRLGKQLELTEAGHYFISKGQIILTQLDDLQFATQRIAAGVETRLNITLNNIVSLRPIYTLLSESELLFPQTEIHIAIDVHDGVWDAYWKNGRILPLPRLTRSHYPEKFAVWRLARPNGYSPSRPIILLPPFIVRCVPTTCVVILRFASRIRR